ncbi:uncharacterized protein LOC118740130 [Rhagoletis pomonella]|uniref:uncharacterized protein LOC118740130 n=1 Tax=Rhagoletis pomonella TaxID=28610 RepID=UPI0017852794|nr:uncharacterized protein LOC118740130 [Rhagoletis pomonella]
MELLNFNMLFMLLIYYIFSIAAAPHQATALELASATHPANLTAEERSTADVATLTYDAHIFMEYFRWHGVHNILLVVCPEDVVAPAGYRNLKSLLLEFIANGFPTRIFNGQDYDDSEQIGRLYESNILTKATPNGPATEGSATFGPPRTFRSDNSTRRPLRLHLPPFTYKSGILLLEFANACALNVLRWSAASENNYFTTNRFWLLLTADEAHISLLDDEEIFLPPDGEVRVMVRQPATQSFAMLDVYKVAAEKRLKYAKMGVPQMRDVNDLLEALQKFGSAISYRQNLEGITFKTGLVIAFPDLFTNIEDISLRHIDTISKVNNRLTIELANKLNMR